MLPDALPLAALTPPALLCLLAVSALVLSDLRDWRVGRYLCKPLAAAAFVWLALRLGAGESPATWQAAGEHLERPVRNGVLAELDAQALAVQPRWTLQLDVRHRDGRQRTAQFDLKLR